MSIFIRKLYETLDEQDKEIDKLWEVVELLLAYEDHDEDIYTGAKMWEELIEKARAARKLDE